MHTYVNTAEFARYLKEITQNYSDHKFEQLLSHKGLKRVFSEVKGKIIATKFNSRKTDRKWTTEKLKENYIAEVENIYARFNA